MIPVILITERMFLAAEAAFPHLEQQFKGRPASFRSVRARLLADIIRRPGILLTPTEMTAAQAQFLRELTKRKAARTRAANLQKRAARAAQHQGILDSTTEAFA